MSVTGLLAATSDVDIQAVGESFSQANRGSYVWGQLPTALVLDKRSGRSNVTTYQLPNLENWMKSGNGLANWEFGNALPSDREIEKATVTITVAGKSTPHGVSRPSRRDTTHRLADLENAIVPGLLSELYAGIEDELVDFLEANATSKTWANTLDDFTATVNPLQDLTTALEALRKYQGIPGMSLEMYMDRRVGYLLAARDAIAGGGGGSGNLTMTSVSEMQKRIQDLLEIDKIGFFHGTRNTATRGKTTVLADAGQGVLWAGMVDRRAGTADMTNEGSYDTIDGFVALAMSREPEVVSGIDDLLEVERFFGRAGFAVYGPRTAVGAEKLGIIYLTGANFS